MTKIGKRDIEKSTSEVFTNNQASKDSVRAIMLIRAYRIRGHLIANLDPLIFKKKMNIQS